jgi:hypothetical protein
MDIDLDMTLNLELDCDRKEGRKGAISTTIMLA